MTMNGIGGKFDEFGELNSTATVKFLAIVSTCCTPCLV